MLKAQFLSLWDGREGGASEGEGRGIGRLAQGPRQSARAALTLLLSPYHLLNRRAGLRQMKVKRASRATARASSVLPVPGGP